MHSLLGTGNIPGIAASTRLTCVFGSAPNAVAAPEKSLDAVAVICAWTSSPTTTSHSPVAPVTRYGVAASAIVVLLGRRPKLGLTQTSLLPKINRDRNRNSDATSDYSYW